MFKKRNKTQNMKPTQLLSAVRSSNYRDKNLEPVKKESCLIGGVVQDVCVNE